MHRRLLATAAVVSLGLAAAGCSTTADSTGSSTTGTTPTTAAASPGSGVAAWTGTPVAATAIPIGDGKVSTTPKVGYQDSCTTTFGGGGAMGTGPWIDTAAGTWNATTKVAVQGSVTWSDASHSFTVHGAQRLLTTDDLPVGSSTGTFPIGSSDPAYQYDRNPNSITAQSLSWTVPADPTAAPTPSCTGLGPIGVATNGVAIFNALDAEGRDAGAHEVQDRCDGHPQMQGMYHYHEFPSCLAGAATAAPGSSTLIGYALDGYGIFLERDAKGNLPTDADLDACHGRTSAVLWDGSITTMYHYDVTLEYPYLVGCFHGTPVRTGG